MFVSLLALTASILILAVALHFLWVALPAIRQRQAADALAARAVQARTWIEEAYARRIAA